MDTLTRYPAFASPTATHQAERRSAINAVPLISTAPLTMQEREALRELGRAHALVGQRIAEALETGRVTHGLEACTLAGDLGVAGARCAARLGVRN